LALGSLFARSKPRVVAVLHGSVWAALILLSCETGCSVYMIVYVYMYYMRVRLSGCLNHIKGTIIIIIIIIITDEIVQPVHSCYAADRRMSKVIDFVVALF